LKPIDLLVARIEGRARRGDLGPRAAMRCAEGDDRAAILDRMAAAQHCVWPRLGMPPILICRFETLQEL